ncbi:spliceosome complex protein [Phaffia rhodozyma]|uniref:Pre-mRNA-splicing factor SYF1 n=1 Tax=Phaffia rhodozyma TaxID=264483 RepID=A0A0F7SJC8_PHARH|nr:spliceosome complex protein [Phaffia rhodozyma]
MFLSTSNYLLQILSPSSLQAEEDLSLNPDNFAAWWTHIHSTRARLEAAEKDAEVELAENDEKDTAENSGASAECVVLGPLRSKEARLGLQTLTSLYERALEIFPTSFKLWKSYILTRQRYVLGPSVLAGTKKQKSVKRKLDVTELLQEIKDAADWEGGLDGGVGFEEWKALIATGERMVSWLPNLPMAWHYHLLPLLHPLCPAPLSRTYARRTFDRALRSLAPSLHGKVWALYLRWAEIRGGEAGRRVWRRFLKVDPSLTPHYLTTPLPSPLERSKLLLSLARQAQAGTYTPVDGQSAYQLFVEWLERVEANADEVGMDWDEVERARAEAASSSGTNAQADADGTADQDGGASVNGKLMRIDGPMRPANTVAPSAVANGKKKEPTQQQQQKKEIYDSATDPSSDVKLDVEQIVMKDGLEVFKDQAGRLWTGLATFWIQKGEFDRAKYSFETGLGSVLTIRDFTQIFDAFTEFSETLISSLMESLAAEDEEDEDDKEGMEQELDSAMQEFEELMDKRPFLVNEVLLRRNGNDVVEWEKRVALYGQDDEKIIETYNKAISTINPRKAPTALSPLYINFAKFYENGGSSDPSSESGEGKNEKDLKSAREVFERAVRVPFVSVDELAEVWCEWAEMEVRNENYDEAIRVMQRATTAPKNLKISYHDETLTVQQRLFKSLKLWSFYVDLEESIGSVESTKEVYDRIMELKIANAQIIVNYAAFLEENKYFEESFKVYERGIDLFAFPIAFELWNIYLSKFVKRYGGTKLERTRDLFEQALEKCPDNLCKPLFLMFAQLEEEHGLAKRAMAIYDRATRAVKSEDKFEMFTIYIAKAAANFGLPATRPIYARAIEVLPDGQTAQMCLRFANLERKLGEIDRARAIYAHASQFCDPRIHKAFWTEWNAFEIDTGSEDTFREMLRIKRAVQAAFNTEGSYLAAQVAAARLGKTNTTASSSSNPANEDGGAGEDPMAALEGAGAAGGPSFVAATKKTGTEATTALPENEGPAANPDEIEMDEDDF